MFYHYLSLVYHGHGNMKYVFILVLESFHIKNVEPKEDWIVYNYLKLKKFEFGPIWYCKSSTRQDLLSEVRKEGVLLEHQTKNHSRPGSCSGVNGAGFLGVVSEILGDGLIVFWNSPDTASSLRSLLGESMFT